MDKAGLEGSIQILQRNKQQWADLPVLDKLVLLRRLRANLRQASGQWVKAATSAKQMDPASPWVGENWIGGPWALAAAITGLIKSLESLVDGLIPQPERVSRRENGQVVAKVFPADMFDRFLFNDVTMEVWMQPDVTEANLSQHMAVFYQQKNPLGSVSLILGAGNITSIPALDILHELYVKGHVVLLKMNPVNEYLGQIFEHIFIDFINSGYLAIVYGGVNTGAFLVQHPDIEKIHMTGSERTYRSIVYGDGPEGAQRLLQDEPILEKPITSELGGVTPVIVIPGSWNRDDITYQAQNIVTMKLQNGGYNCIAAQVLILPQNWDLSQPLLEAIRTLMRQLPPRYPYYPGTAERVQKVIRQHPDAEQLDGKIPRLLITDLDPDNEEEHCYRDELFCEALAQVSLEGDTPSEFLQNAVRFCNEKLAGTLGANIIVHPSTAKTMEPVLEAAIDDLHYGSVSLNIWAAAAFLLPQATWGGHPEHKNNQIESGYGVVHNCLMFDKPQKTVVRASFYPFPRSLLHGEFHIAPKPSWFVTHETAHITNRRAAWLAADRNPKHLPGIILSTLRG